MPSNELRRATTVYKINDLEPHHEVAIHLEQDHQGGKEAYPASHAPMLFFLRRALPAKVPSQYEKLAEDPAAVHPFQ